MSLAIVQSAQFITTSKGTTIPFTLGETPIVGSVLLAFTAWSDYGGPRTVSPPDETWTKIDEDTNGYAGLVTWWHLVEEGDGTEHTFTMSGTNEYRSGVIYEVSGADGSSPIDQHSILGEANGATATPTAVTPSVLSTLALAAVTMASWNGEVSGVSEGWTLDEEGNNYPVTSWGAHRDDLTTDTTTPITTTFTFTGSVTTPLSAIMLVAPSGAPPAGVPWLYLNRNARIIGVNQ